MADGHLLLLVEDNDADIDLTVEILSASEVPLTVRVVKDGVAALEAISTMAAEDESSLPDLVVLDLNLPLRDGRQVLAAIRDDIRTRHVPVVVLTSSDSPQDILRSYQLGANSYITKPGDLGRYRLAIEAIRDYWLSVSSLPRGGPLGAGGAS